MRKNNNARPTGRAAAGRAQRNAAQRSASASLHESILLRNPNGRPVGAQRADGFFEKRVDSTKHQLRTPAAWAIAETHFEQLKQLRAAGVRLLDERARVWTATLEAFECYALHIKRSGYEAQLALPLPRWRCERADAQQLTLL